MTAGRTVGLFLAALFFCNAISGALFGKILVNRHRPITRRDGEGRFWFQVALSSLIGLVLLWLALRREPPAIP
jgi:hypothetical protein